MRYEVRQILALVILLGSLAGNALAQQPTANQQPIPVHLQVDAGTPLRLYITKRVSYRAGEAVEAKSIEPVWAFDRIVIPAGATVEGRVAKLDSVSKMMRAQAMVGGDFTPLKVAQVSFLKLILPDGRSLPLQTEETVGLSTVYVPPRPSKKPKKQKARSANSTRVRQFLKQQAQSQANVRSRGLYELVRGPNKLEWLENFALSKLPYHPQWYRSNTRFDAVLTQPLDFGNVEVAASELAKPGTPPPPDSTAQMTLLTTVSSSDAKVGDPMQGVLSLPLFTPDHKVLLPQGTHFTGRITSARRARMWHRGGKLRFAIEEVEVPRDETAAENTAAAATREPQRTQAQMVAVEAGPKPVKVDSEGTATATESKTRLLRPAIAALIAAKSMDNDAGKQTASGSAPSNSTGPLVRWVLRLWLTRDSGLIRTDPDRNRPRLLRTGLVGLFDRHLARKRSYLPKEHCHRYPVWE